MLLRPISFEIEIIFIFRGYMCYTSFVQTSETYTTDFLCVKKRLYTIFYAHGHALLNRINYTQCIDRNNIV